MHDSLSKYGSILTYLGVLPFWLAAAAIFFGFEHDFAVLALRAYGAVIVSFISGIHWGIAMQDSQRKTLWLLASSNAIALMAWASLLAHSAISALCVLTLAFIVLLTIDSKLYRLQQIDLWFIRLRWRATLLVLISFGCAEWAL